MADKTYVRIDNDNMKAYLFLIPPMEDAAYTRRELIKLLNDNRVTSCIDVEAIDYMIEQCVYLREFKVAEGEPPVNGTDGYYEFFFNKVLDKKPSVKEDGTVDYWSIHSIENVYKDQTIALYHPAVQGVAGIDVRGKALLPKRARELLPLKGKGFEKLSDNLTYVSLLDGKIEFIGGRIIVSEIYEIFGDADLNVGNINFTGDVIIHGKVHEGITINAGGSLTVDGPVEAATITAGKDIIFRSGMLGGYKSSVYTKGNIYARFFENATVEAGGNIEVSELMNTVILGCGRLILNGKKAVIIGGEVRAIQGVDAVKIGNESEVPTDIFVGVPDKVIKRKKMLDKMIAKTRENIAKIELGIEQFDELIKKDSRIRMDDPRKARLIRAKIQDNVILQKSVSEMEQLQKLIAKGGGATVRVEGYCYPRVRITIDDAVHIETAKQLAVEYYKEEGEVRTRDIYVNI